MFWGFFRQRLLKAKFNRFRNNDVWLAFYPTSRQPTRKKEYILKKKTTTTNIFNDKHLRKPYRKKITFNMFLKYMYTDESRTITFNIIYVSCLLLQVWECKACFGRWLCLCHVTVPSVYFTQVVKKTITRDSGNETVGFIQTLGWWIKTVLRIIMRLWIAVK